MKRFFGVGFAAAAFALYVGALLSLPQARSEARFCCEQSSFAAAASNYLYGTQFGSMYAGVFDHFVYHMRDQSLSATLAQAHAMPQGELSPTTLDGNGVGYPLLMTAAFHIFGMQPYAPLGIMLGFMLSSVGMLLWRWPGASAVPTLYFAGLTALLFTPLVDNPAYSINLPIAGIRYWSLVGILPAFHVLLELLDREPVPRGSFLLLAGQSAVLMTAMMVRGSALGFVLVIMAVASVLCWKRPFSWPRHLLLGKKMAVVIATGTFILVEAALIVSPQYRHTGRFATVLWQRVTESLGVNPSFPWPGVNEMYDCAPYVPQGIETGPSDSNGACIWFDYVKKHHIPMDDLPHLSFGAQYEGALKIAFFDIAQRYPWETAKTFLWYKPQWIFASLDETLRFSPNWWLWGAVLLVLIHGLVMPVTRRVGAVALIIAAGTIPAYIAAWARPHTTADLALLSLMLLALIVGRKERVRR